MARIVPVKTVDMSLRTLSGSLSPKLQKVEDGFDIERAVHWMSGHWQYSVYISIIYVAFVFGGKHLMRDRKPFHLRKPLVLWNIGLAVFSIYGMFGVVPNLIRNIHVNGLVYSCCNSTALTTPRYAVWGWMFTLSKVLELGDTAFIVLRKSPLPFLHWYHHITVFIFSWYSMSGLTAQIHWFGSLNYTIHAVMYTYYGLRAFGYKLPSILAKSVTALQLSQMFVGIFVNGVAFRATLSGVACTFYWDIFYLAVAMYSSYAILFMNFFYQRYIRKAPRKKTQ